MLDYALRRDYKHPRLIHSALEYATLGLRVTPLSGKNAFLDRWSQRATCDPHKVVAMFETWHDKNIGLVMGDGLIALDIDPRNGGTDSFRKLLKGRGLPQTAEAITGSGGRHFLFRVDPALRIGNTTGLLPGIDIKGEGGQIAAEPSVHPRTGHEYVWVRKPGQVIAEAPRWLVRLLTEQRAPKLDTPPRTAPLTLNRDGDEARLLEVVVSRFPVERRGQRNDQMVRALSSLIGRGYEQDITRRVISAWWAHFDTLGVTGTPLSEAPRLIEASMRSIINSPKFKTAVGTDHRAELAKIELDSRQTEMLSWEVTPTGSAILPPHSNRVTTTKRLCRNQRERAFVEALVVYFTYKRRMLHEEVVKATNTQLCWVMEDRHGLKLANPQIEREARKFISRPGKPATRFELAIQTFKGTPGRASEYRPTGLMTLLSPEGLYAP